MDGESLWAAVVESTSDLRDYLRAVEIENESLKKENAQLRIRFDRFSQIQALAALLSPAHTEDSLEPLCHRLGLAIDDGDFCAVSFFNKSYSNEGRVGESPFADVEMVEWLSQIQRAMTVGSQTVSAPIGDTILAVIRFPSKGSTVLEYRSDLLSCLRRISQERQEAGQLQLYAAVSPMVRGVRNLYRAYDVVKTLMDYKSLMEDLTKDVLIADELTIWPPQAEQPAGSGYYEKFTFLVGMGDFTSARAEARQIIEQRLLNQSAMITIQLNLSALKDFLAHTLGKACRELNLSDYYDQHRISGKVITAQTVHEFASQVDAVLAELAEAFAARDPKSSLPQRIMSYIDENYADPDINVNSVAEYFNITPTHATRIFRSVYQCSILDYIHMCRINAVKEQLGHGLTIREIAESTGYRTSANLIRAFKRVEGITPGQFSKSSDD